MSVHTLSRSFGLHKLSVLLSHIRRIHSLRWFIATGGVVAVMAIGSATTLAFNAPLRTVVFQKLAILPPNKPIVQSRTQAQRPQLTPTTPPAPAPTPATPPATPVVSGSQSTGIRYKTSPDPKSDAWSSTPPGPTPGDINISVTGPGQVQPGTKIVYSAVKEDTIYYGGDMVFSTSTVVFHKGQSLFSAPLTVSTPDGDAMTAPHDPWYDTSPNYWVSFDGDPGATMASWPITFEISNTLPAGTYQAHITAWRSGGTGTLEWEYDGFVTLEVED